MGEQLPSVVPSRRGGALEARLSKEFTDPLDYMSPELWAVELHYVTGAAFSDLSRGHWGTSSTGLSIFAVNPGTLVKQMPCGRSRNDTGRTCQRHRKAPCEPDSVRP